MKYFVTGGTGFIGGRLVKFLIEDGHTVHALVRNSYQAGALVKMGERVRIFQGDILNKFSMIDAMKNVDGVFHVAGWYRVGSRDKHEGEMVNVRGTRNVLELMSELSIPKGVYTSSLAVFSDTRGQIVNEKYRFAGQHLNEYDRTKWVAHYEVAEPMIKAGLPLVIVMPGLVYGPGDNTMVRATLLKYLRGGRRFLPKQTAFCWAHVDDVARAHISAMERGTVGESYIIAGSAHSLENSIRIAERVSGLPAARVTVGPAVMKTAARAMDLLEKFLPVSDTYAAESLRTLAGVTYLGSNSKARLDLGYNPRPLEEGLTETILHELKLLNLN